MQPRQFAILLAMLALPLTAVQKVDTTFANLERKVVSLRKQLRAKADGNRHVRLSDSVFDARGRGARLKCDEDRLGINSVKWRARAFFGFRF